MLQKGSRTSPFAYVLIFSYDFCLIFIRQKEDIDVRQTEDRSLRGKH